MSDETVKAERVRHQAENMPLLMFVDSDVEEGETRALNVTPYEAAYVLKHRNPHNRNIREAYAAGMARNMLAGKWPINGETMGFSWDGFLLDGQHRFVALASLTDVPEGFTVRFLVSAGLDPASQETMDLGLKRTPGDVLRLRGIAHPVAVGAIARKLWHWESGDLRFQTRRNPLTMTELLDFLEQRPRLHRSAEISKYVRNHYRSLPPSIVGLAHYLFTGIDEETSAWFFQRIADGANLPTGHPVHSLRESLSMGWRGNLKGRLPEDEYMAMLVRTWNAVRRGDNLYKIQGVGSDGKMPLPK